MHKKRLLGFTVVLGMMALLVGCTADFSNVRLFNLGNISGSGAVVSHDFDVENFNALDISGNYLITWRQSDEVSVTVSMQENLFEFLEVSVQSETLVIDAMRTFNIGHANRPRIDITSPYLEMIRTSGAVYISDWDSINAQHFSIHAAGAANITLSLAVDSFEAHLAGAGDLTLSGNATEVNMTLAGAGNIEATHLQTNQADIVLTGAGNIDVAVSDYLTVNLTGAGRVRYTGNPTIERNILGAGRLEQQ
ncbi:MAG: DUF2807 domain-containing protein [Defluviitaleaceae bacterium]|nr:DUF2807 domain-containing protein [Defluviitaleaceae bacterium]